MTKSPIAFLRSAALAEAVSYLVLLGIAMPLKYFADMPMAVRIVGSFHGLLFVVLCVALLRAMISANLTFVRAVIVFVASLVPFVPFWLDRKMRTWEPTASDAKHHG